MQGNLSRFSGFAEGYDTYRPKPPPVLKEILLHLAQVTHPRLVVDLGSGTGLSTRFWADAADHVVGVEPNDDMRAEATAVTKHANVVYTKGLSSQTGIDDGTADIVTCSQSLHWMEPWSTFGEVARILRAGGIFAAYDCDWPPTTGLWQADQEYDACTKRLASMEQTEADAHEVQKWPKHEHLDRMRKSGVFTYVKEITVHHVEEGTSERFVGLLLSQGGIQSLLKSGRTEQELGIDAFRARCRELLGEDQSRWYWSYRVRVGVKK
jgi:ubiquinone/menaquinone biosynthesis C-methylase UbiE